MVLFLEYSSAAAYEVSAVRDVAPRKLSFFWNFGTKLGGSGVWA